MCLKEKYFKKLAEALGVNEIDLGTAIIKTKGQYKKTKEKTKPKKRAVIKTFIPNKEHVELAMTIYSLTK